MKWIVSILSAAFLLFSLTACGNGHTDPETTDMVMASCMAATIS